MIVEPDPGLYLHVKTKQLYQVFGVFLHSETDEPFVAYVHVDGIGLNDHRRQYVRPLLGSCGFATPGRFVKQKPDGVFEEQ